MKKNLNITIFALWMVLLSIVLVILVPAFVLAANGDTNIVNYNWGQLNAKIYEAQQITKGSNDVIVGVVDSGISFSHPQLMSAMYYNEEDSLHTSYVGGESNNDINGHGTMVAGVIASQFNDELNICGVAPNIKIVSIKVFNAEGRLGDNERLINAIKYADDHNIKILNYSGISLETITTDNYDADLFDAINEYSENDGLLVVSAGSDAKNTDIYPCYPASFDLKSGYGNIQNKDNIISVGALDVDGTIAAPCDWGDPNKGSNYGATSVDLFAPGTNIYTTSRTGGYEYVSGTSFAAPFVTGVAAMLKSIDPTLTGSDIKNIILRNVDGVTALEGKCVTGGKLNAFKAVNSVAYNFDIESKSIESPKFIPNGDLILPTEVWKKDDSFSVEGDAFFSVEGIADQAFYNCSALTSITIPNSVTEIGIGAFSGCTNLEEVTIPEGVIAISREAFSGCTALEEIIIPSSVEYIDSYAFMGSGLRSVSFAENSNGNTALEYIGMYAFALCDQLGTIILPEGLLTIDQYAFQMSGLGTITLPSTLTHIYTGAFVSCVNLTTLVLPDNLIQIGGYVFSNCVSLTTITIPNSVTSIGEGAFQGCTSLNSVVLPTGLTSIATNTFAGCSALTSITIPSSVTTIGNNAFDSSGLTSITIPNSVTTIGDYVFKNCVGLTEITIPSSVEYVGKRTFYNCSNLETIIVDDYDDNGWHFNWKYGCDADVEYNEIIAEPIIELIYTDLGSVYSVSVNSQFASILTEITIPATYLGEPVAVIDDYGFANCSLLQTIIIEGSSLTYIEDMAFANCSVLTTISLPNSLTGLGDGVFYNCTELESINIPNNLSEIGEDVFENCYALTSVTLSQEATTYYADLTLQLYSTECTIYTDGMAEEVNWFIEQLGVSYNVFYGCTFSEDGEYVVSMQAQDFDDSIQLSPPHREGYVFVMWDSDDGNYYTMEELANATGTLYTVWMPVD